MNLLQLANYDLRYASIAMMTYKDEGAIRHCAFLVQQATEKVLKYIMTQQLVREEYTHDITLLISIVEEGGGYVPPYIRDTAKRITSWQSTARYSRIFHVPLKDIEKTFMVVQEYLEYTAYHYGLVLTA